MEPPVPYEKLRFLKERLAPGEAGLAELDPFREAFASRKKEFAARFHDFFSGITETRIIMEQLEDPGRLKKFWAQWFERIFSGRLDDAFLAYLWGIGARHVDVGLDQRFSNLGFSVVRQFCHEVISSDVPPDKRFEVAAAVGRLIDLCLLVETSAYISATTRCDPELIRGIADKVRNKITVIGGYARMLQRKIAPGDPAYEVYESLIAESTVCEHMVKDIYAYNDVFRREPVMQEVRIKELIGETLETLRLGGRFGDVRVEVAFGPGAEAVGADPRDMKHLFFYVLENALEAAAEGAEPLVKVSSLRERNFVCVEVFNSGAPPRADAVEKFFSPFYSTKPEGSGFGVPIASLAARKNFGKLSIEPVEGKGTKVSVSLPAPLSA